MAEEKKKKEKEEEKPKKKGPESPVKKEGKISEFSVMHSGTFDLKAIYDAFYFWLREESYNDIKENKDYYEIFYQELVEGEHMKMNMWWRAQKKVDQYFQKVLSINFRGITIKKVELQQGTETVKAHKGEITIMVKGTLVYDYDNLWGRNDLTKFLATSLMKKKINESWKTNEDEFWDELNTLQDFIKQQLGIQQAPATTFHPVGRKYVR